MLPASTAVMEDVVAMAAREALEVEGRQVNETVS